MTLELDLHGIRLGLGPDRIDQPPADAPQFDSEHLWPVVSSQARPGARVLVVRGVSASADGVPAGGAEGSGREWLLEQVKACFFGPMRVSVMLDANGANTTAAAAVLAAARHAPLRGAEALVLAATGPVGRRATRLLAREGARVRLGSRSLERAEETLRSLQQTVEGAALLAVQTATSGDTAAALEGVQVVIAAGAAGVELLPGQLLADCPTVRVAIDLNAVQPLVERLANLLRADDFEAQQQLDAILERLAGSELADSFAELRAHIARYDFDGALRRLQEIRGVDSR